MDTKNAVEEAKIILKQTESIKSELMKIKTEIAKVVAESRVIDQTNKNEVEDLRQEIHKVMKRNQTLLYL